MSPRGGPLSATLRLPGGAARLDLGPGQAHLLTGPEGPAAVAALTGLEVAGRAPGSGHRIHLAGRPLHRRSPARRVRAGLGMVVGAPVAEDVTALDHLAAVAGVRRARRALACTPRLVGRGHLPAAMLSGGERRLIAWLRCDLTEPGAVVLYAAGTGLDPASMAWAGERVSAWRRAGVAVVVCPGRPEEREWV